VTTDSASIRDVICIRSHDELLLFHTPGKFGAQDWQLSFDGLGGWRVIVSIRLASGWIFDVEASGEQRT
jgi:hypothetical protein